MRRAVAGVCVLLLAYAGVAGADDTDACAQAAQECRDTCAARGLPVLDHGCRSTPLGTMTSCSCGSTQESGQTGAEGEASTDLVSSSSSSSSTVVSSSLESEVAAALEAVDALTSLEATSHSSSEKMPCHETQESSAVVSSEVIGLQQLFGRRVGPFFALPAFAIPANSNSDPFAMARMAFLADQLMAMQAQAQMQMQQQPTMVVTVQAGSDAAGNGGDVVFAMPVAVRSSPDGSVMMMEMGMGRPDERLHAEATAAPPADHASVAALALGCAAVMAAAAATCCCCGACARRRVSAKPREVLVVDTEDLSSPLLVLDSADAKNGEPSVTVVRL